jgi:hypothetical protein
MINFNWNRKLGGNMSKIFSLLIMSVAIGIISLFATFFIILGLHKTQLWVQLHKKINFKEKK